MRTSSVDLIILDTLAHQSQHLTSLEIYEIIRKQLPAVNQSTVYRALDRLAGQGRISVSDMGSGAEVFESTDHGRHHHFVCQCCKHTITIDDSRIQEFFHSLELEYDVNIATNHLVLFGLCPVCKGTNCEKEAE
jgi:Fur family transcriptional regulator, ferric uptake regulator